MAAGGRELFIILVGLLWAVSLTYTFNLEPGAAHIYQYPYANIQEREAYFGYAVALQHIEDLNTNWVIVGAPRANSTYHDKNVIAEPGALFRCSLDSDTCKELQVDTKGNVAYNYGPSQYRYKDLKNYGWLGGSLDSQPIYQSNRQATCVCAPQWKDQRWKINRHMNGACYIAFNTISNDTEFEKKVPLVHRLKQMDGKFERYAYGQAGFSVHFPDDPTKLVIGTPGVFRWKGSVLLFEDEKEESGGSTKRKKRQVQTPEEMYLNSDVLQTDEIGDSELFGYSVTSGKFLRRNETDFAAGAPRGANSFGKVIMFAFPSRDDKLLTRKVFRGEQIGEYFGAALTAADINGDGLDDLIVGSPMYSGNNLNIPDSGRIQSFLSIEESYVRPKSHYGNKVISARFGTSLASPGDLNADSFEDVVVGAPWEGDGAVYIFLGSSSGLKTRWSQRLSPENFTPGLRGFGMSISRGIDIDNNGYSDLAIGSFLSGHVLVVKSRPVVQLTGEITPSPSSVAWEGSEMVAIKTCLHYKGHRLPSNLSVRARLILEPGNITFRAMFDDKTNTFSFDEDLLVNEDKCRIHQVTVKADKINPNIAIRIRLEYQLMDNPIMKLIEKPLTDPVADNYTMGFIGIVKDCNDICEVNMTAKAEFINGTKNDVVIGKINKLRVEVSNSGEAAYLPTMTMTADPRLILIPPASYECNFLDNDMKILLKCQLSNPIKNSSSSDIVDVGVKVNESHIVGNISPLELQVNVSSEGKEVGPKGNIISMDLRLATQADLKMLGHSEEEQVPYKLTDDKKSIITKNAKFNHTYILIKKGPTSLKLIDLILNIPVSFTNGLDFVKVYGWKEIFSDPFIFKCELKGTKKSKHSTRSTNSAGGDPVTRGSSSDRSSLESQAVSAETELDGVQYFNCSSSMIKCAQLYCSIPDWVLSAQSAKVTVELDIDLSILGQHISVKDGAVFASMATATIQSLNPEMVFIGNRMIRGEVVTYIQSDTLRSKGVPWWVIVLAVLGSLLLLGLLAYVMYKKGFFKRETKEEMKAQQARLENHPDGVSNPTPIGN